MPYPIARAGCDTRSANRGMRLRLRPTSAPGNRQGLILGHVEFSTHKLPHGYLGDVETDEDLVIVAGREAYKVIDDEKRAKCLELIREEQEEIRLDSSIARYAARVRTQNPDLRAPHGSGLPAHEPEGHCAEARQRKG